MEIWTQFATTSLGISLLAFAVIIIFFRILKNESKTRNAFINISLVIFSTSLSLLILEIIFGVFVVQSDGYGFTLSSKRWFHENWKPINSDGYRDYEHKWKPNVIFVVGDSFVAGHGLKNIDDRLSGQLAKKLGDQWSVAVLAQNGWGPISEYNALVNHRKRPQKIILSYYINDIESAAEANHFHRPQLVKMPNDDIRFFTDNSYVLNWIYWRLYRGGFGDAYWNYLKQAFSDPKIWNSHENELMNIIDFSRNNGSEIVFVVWPNLNDIDGSLVFTSKVVAFLIEQEVEVIDLAKYFQNRQPSTLVVNAMDGHPNKKANMEVSELIYKRLFVGE